MRAALKRADRGLVRAAFQRADRAVPRAVGHARLGAGSDGAGRTRAARRSPGAEGPGAAASGQIRVVSWRLRADRRRVLTGAARGLLVSPWFAAGAGFVIAAGAFIYAPHAQLKFGGATIIGHCASPCKRTPLPGEMPLDGPTPQPIATPPPNAAAGLSFGYVVTWQSHKAFAMVVSITGKHPLGTWRLAFEVPGATRISVLDAGWQSSGPDAGTASSLTDAQSASGQQSHRDGYPRGGASSPDQAFFVVTVEGTRTVLTGCEYDGAVCHFSPG